MDLENLNRTGIVSAAGMPTLQTAPSQTLLGRFMVALAGSLLVAACAHLSVHLPFTPVPLTLSDLAVLLVGLALGPYTACAAMVLYLVEGATGLPVFNPGPGGVLQLLGPTGGYLMAYPVAAALAGLLSRKLTGFRTRFAPAVVASAIASSTIMICGVLWLSIYAHRSLTFAFYLGAVPFIPGQIVKVLSAAGIVTSLQHVRRA